MGPSRIGPRSGASLRSAGTGLRRVLGSSSCASSSGGSVRSTVSSVSSTLGIVNGMRTTVRLVSGLPTISAIGPSSRRTVGTVTSTRATCGTLSSCRGSLLSRTTGTGLSGLITTLITCSVMRNSNDS